MAMLCSVWAEIFLCFLLWEIWHTGLIVVLSLFNYYHCPKAMFGGMTAEAPGIAV